MLPVSLLSAFLPLTWTAAATTTDYPRVQIYPVDIISSGDQTSVLNLYAASLSVTADDNYILDLAGYVQSRTNQQLGPYPYYVTEQTVSSGFELYDTEALVVGIGEETATATLYLSYIEVNLG